jgi:hypothetical protein
VKRKPKIIYIEFGCQKPFDTRILKRKEEKKMTIDELYSYYNTTAVTASNDISSVQNVKSDEDNSSETVDSSASAELDTYVSTISSQATELRSENYNDILDQIRQAKANKENTDTEDAETASSALASATTDDTSASGAAGGVSAGGGAGGSSSDDEEETTTIVVINGQRYKETTTTNSDGTTTVTRIPLGEAGNDDSQTTNFSAAAEALSL